MDEFARCIFAECAPHASVGEVESVCRRTCMQFFHMSEIEDEDDDDEDDAGNPVILDDDAEDEMNNGDGENHDLFGPEAVDDIESVDDDYDEYYENSEEAENHADDHHHCDHRC